MPSRQAAYKKKRYAGDSKYREELKQISRSFWAVNKKKLNARRRSRLRTDPEYRERQRDYRFRRYGLSRHDYEALWARQGGVCAICKRKFRRRLGIDHCHVCNTVRGLLCSQCNAGLGMYGDDPDRMRVAIGYLESSCGREAHAKRVRAPSVAPAEGTLALAPGSRELDSATHRPRPRRRAV